MAWLCMRTEQSKEIKVIENLPDGMLGYIPMECRIYRHGVGRSREIKEIPITPRLIFIRHPDPRGLHDIIGHKYTLGLIRDATGAVYVISDYQMQRFQEAVSTRRLEALSAYSKLKAKKSKRPKLRSFEALKAYMDGLANEAA